MIKFLAGMATAFILQAIGITPFIHAGARALAGAEQAGREALTTIEAQRSSKRGAP